MGTVFFGKLFIGKFYLVVQTVYLDKAFFEQILFGTEVHYHWTCTSNIVTSYIYTDVAYDIAKFL